MFAQLGLALKRLSFARAVAGAIVFFHAWSAVAGIGKTEVLTVKGSRDQIERNVTVILPDNYDPSKKYPVLYYFHGYDGSAKEISTLKMEQLQDILVSTGVLKPFIVVSPDLKTDWAMDHPDPNQRQSESFLIQDLIPEIDRKLSTDGERWAVGHSMGAFASMNLAGKHPGLFSKVSIIQPVMYKEAPWFKGVHLSEQVRDAMGDPAKLDEDNDSAKDLNDTAKFVANVQAELNGLMPTPERFRDNSPIGNILRIPPDQRPDLSINEPTQDYASVYPEAVQFQKDLDEAGYQNVEFRYRQNLSHGRTMVVGSFLDSLIFLKGPNGQNSGSVSGFGNLLIRLRDQNRLEPIMRKLMNGDVLGGLALLGQALESYEPIKLSKQDIDLLKRLIHANLDSSDQLNSLDALQSVDFVPAQNGQLQVKVGFAPLHCSLDDESKLNNHCTKDRVLLPLKTTHGIRRLKEAAEQEMRFLGMNPCHPYRRPNFRQIFEFSQKIEKITDEIKGGFAQPYMLELGPEVSFTTSFKPSSKKKAESDAEVALTQIQGLNLLIHTGLIERIGLKGLKTTPTGSEVRLGSDYLQVPISLP